MKRTFSLVVVFALAFGLMAAQQASAAEKVAPVIKSGELTGTVTNSSGQALDKIALQLLDMNEKVVVKAVTGEDGAFKTAKVGEGDYVLSVDGKHKFAVKVADDGTITKLLVVAPDAPLYSAAQLGGGVGGGIGGVGGGIGAGGVAAAAGAVGVVAGTAAAADSADDDDDAISP